MHNAEIFGDSISQEKFLSQSRLILIPLKTSFPPNRFKHQAAQIFLFQHEAMQGAGMQFMPIYFIVVMITDIMAMVSSGIILLVAVMGKLMTCDLGESPEFTNIEGC